jgi:methionyl-tRNA formyltransferase
MRMEAGLDTGPVLLRATTPIGATDTTGDLHDRLSVLGAALILRALATPDLPATPQPDDGVTYAAKIDKAEARVDWTRPAPDVARQINGLSPFPGAWAMAGPERLKLLRARAVPGSGRPGQVAAPFTVACGTGAVDILQAQREGRRAAMTADLLHGWTPPDLA